VTSFTIRLGLPPRWFPVGRDDPGTWMGEFIASSLPGAGEPEREALLEELLGVYGLAESTGAVEAMVHLPDDDEHLRAVLLGYPTSRRSWFTRGAPGHAAPLARTLRRSAAGPVDVRPVELPSGPAVRLHAVADDELGRAAEQVLHVVVPPRAPGAVVLRVQWAPGRADAAELADMSDLIARDALVEVW
jgi:hypothetical protein